MQILAQNANLKQTYHCGEYQLGIRLSDSRLGQIKLLWHAYGEFHSQALFVLGRKILELCFDYSLQIFVTLHNGQTLVVSELRLGLDCKRFEHRALRNCTVPVRFKLCPKYLVGCRAVLYKNWDMRFGECRLRKTQLLLVDVETEATEYKVIAYCNMLYSAYDSSGLFVTEKKANSIRVFRVEI